MKQKIAVVELNHIGDLILLTPLLAALKQAFPGALLHVVAGRKNYLVAQYHPLVDRVHVYTKRFFSTIKFILDLRKTRFDVWIDPKGHYSAEGTFLAYIARAPVRIGYNRGERGVFTHPVRTLDSACEHYTQRSLHALEHISVTAGATRPLLYVRTECEQALAHFLKERAISEYCMVNISANGPDRSWEKEKWAACLKKISDVAATFVITCHPKDRDDAVYLAQNVPHAHVFDSASILEVFSVASHAKLVLTVDTCVVHIASAFNVPVLALYANFREFYSQYLPLSGHYRAVMGAGAGDPVSVIPAEKAAEEARSLMREIASAR